MEGLNYYHGIYSDSNILIVTHGAVMKTLVDNQRFYGKKDNALAYAAPGDLFKIDLQNREYEIKEAK